MSVEELRERLKAMPAWHPWDTAELAIASLRDMLRLERETCRNLREALSASRSEVLRLKAGRP